MTEISLSNIPRHLHKIGSQLAKEKIIYITRFQKQIFALVDIAYLKGRLERDEQIITSRKLRQLPKISKME